MATSRTPRAPRKASTPPAVPVGTVVEATKASILAAKSAPGGGHLTAVDDAAIAALLVLAQKIDDLADVKAGVSGSGDLIEDQKRPYQLDNVSMPTFLKYCDALGLTPAGRKALAEKKQGGASGGSALEGLREGLRGIQGGKAS